MTFQPVDLFSMKLPDLLQPVPDDLTAPELHRKGAAIQPWTGFKPPPPPEDEQAMQVERWRAWQKSPAAAGKGSASILEFLCFEYLVNVKNLKENLDFFYQYPLAGGRTAFGGFVADFFIVSTRLVWNPAGLHFHWTSTLDRAQDIASTVLLANKGIKQIFLWEDDMTNRLTYTLDQAWEGHQLPGRYGDIY